MGLAERGMAYIAVLGVYFAVIVYITLCKKEWGYISHSYVSISKFTSAQHIT